MAARRCPPCRYPTKKKQPNDDHSAHKDLCTRFWEALTDERGIIDIAYVSIAALTLSATTSVLYLLVMGTIVYARCDKIVEVGQGVRAAIPCEFPFLNVGQSVSWILAGAAGFVTALGVYMAANRRTKPAQAAQP